MDIYAVFQMKAATFATYLVIQQERIMWEFSIMEWKAYKNLGAPLISKLCNVTVFASKYSAKYPVWGH